MSTRNKIIVFFTLAVGFILFAFFLNIGFEQRAKNKNFYKSKLERSLHQKEALLKKVLDAALNEIPSSSDSVFFANETNRQLDDEGISFLLYDHDTLIYWSNITFPGTTLYETTAYDSNMIKVGNGWYRVIHETRGGFCGVGLIQIRKEYRFENDYLVNGFHESFDLPESIQINREKNENAIYSSDGEYLFSLEFKKKIPLGSGQSTCLFLLYLTGFLFFIAGLFQVNKKLFDYYKSPWLFVGAFTLDLLIIRLALFHFRIPTELYRTVVFSPLNYASSELLPSFGDLTVNTLIFIIIAWVFYRNITIREPLTKKLHPYLRLLLSSATLFCGGLAYYLLLSVLRGMVVDSVIPFTLNNVFNLNLYSVFGFLIISALILGFVLFSLRVFNLLYRITERGSGYLVSALFGFSLLLLFHVLSFKGHWFEIISYAVFVLGFWLFRERLGKGFLFARLVFGLIFFSMVSTYVLHQSNVFKEKEKRKSLAQKLSASQDPIAEYLYENLEKEMISDSKLKELIPEYPDSETEIKKYVQDKYFRGYWDKYQVQITVCSNSDSLFIKPDMINQSCLDYFNSTIEGYGKRTTSENLYVLNYGTGGNSYLSKISYDLDSTRSVSVFIELYSKFIPKGLGYPELLIDKKIFLNTDLSNYSYARYRNAQLVDAYGKYYYSIKQDPADTLEAEIGFFDRNGYNHLYYKVDQNSNLIISGKKEGLLEAVAPFSLLFLFNALFMLVFFTVVVFPYHKEKIRLNFKNRLQLSMIAMILISFVLIGVSMYYYIRNLNENKNIENLSEKALSILIETQAKLAEYDTLNPEMEAYVSNYLVKFSNVFFTDINLFDLKGNLISSSRPQIFNEGLMADRMDPEAYNELVFNKKTIYIHKERIGGLEYYSAYLPFYNNKNNLTAYLNLPYFARENELKQELSTFMMAFINIYVFLVAIAITIALLIAGRMTRPLKEIREKIGKVKLGGKNEKIIWARQADEIGDLVHEYNRMIDELSLSAELLAKSERESAWREMAKQVAHEIKNPLTPMKLSVQYLEKAWKDQSPDWEEKLKRFTKTLIEQIESLAAIASAFSDFAKMPRSDMQRLDLNEIIGTSVATFTGSKVKVIFKPESGNFYVLADKKQLIRVLNNLITNAIQAIGDQADGRVEISIQNESEHIRVQVSDNGPGIPEEQKARIFTPNFSTKTEGMGLGLAMVKNIIEGHGGSIWFLSREGEGASFLFEIPEYKE